MRFINAERVVAVQLTTPAENPLVSEDNRLIDVWFEGAAVRKQLFKKVTRREEESFVEALQAQGFVRSKNLLVRPSAVLFAEMENEMLGGIVTIGYQDNGKPVELKVSGKAFGELCAALAGGAV